MLSILASYPAAAAVVVVTGFNLCKAFMRVQYVGIASRANKTKQTKEIGPSIKSIKSIKCSHGARVFSAVSFHQTILLFWSSVEFLFLLPSMFSCTVYHLDLVLFVHRRPQKDRRAGWWAVGGAYDLDLNPRLVARWVPLMSQAAVARRSRLDHMELVWGTLDLGLDPRLDPRLEGTVCFNSTRLSAAATTWAWFTPLPAVRVAHA
jgi:hypothetical protein